MQADVWDELTGLLSKKNWPRHPRRSAELYKDVSHKAQDWPERMEALMTGYALVNPKAASKEEL